MPRTGRPVNPLTAVNRARGCAAAKRAVILDGLDLFFTRQRLRLMKGTIGRGTTSNGMSTEEIQTAYREQRLGRALDESDRSLQVRRRGVFQ